MQALWKDIRHALRMFRVNPGLTAVAVLSLAIGIGPNAAVFSLIDGLGFWPLPIRDPASLLLVSSTTPKDRAGEASYAGYLEIRDGVPAFATVAALATQGVSIAGGPQGPGHTTVRWGRHRGLIVLPIIWGSTIPWVGPRWRNFTFNARLPDSPLRKGTE